MSKKTLLLNASYEVLSFIPERKVFKLLFKDKVEVESTWDDFITWGSGKMKHPSVVRLKKHVRRNFFNSNFSRKALVKRDRSTCFVPETDILMENGALKKIKDVKVGDKVIDAFCNVQVVEYVSVKDVAENILHINVIGNSNTLKCTKEHKILTTDWTASYIEKEGICANNLSNRNYVFGVIPQMDASIIDGDLLSDNTRNIVDNMIISKIQSIKKEYYIGKVYDLQISGSHTYVANGIAVHNCQYCDKKLSASQITVDHVLPRAQGGITSFTNCVVCCQICNNKKADRTPEQAGMTLLKRPTHPSFSAHHYVADPQEHWHPAWDDFLSH